MERITFNTGGAIDVGSIVTALMDIERIPLQRIEERAQGVRAEISEIGRLQSALSTFQDAARELKDAQTWRAATGVSSDDSAVGISASSGALVGSYAVKVNQLASHQTVVSQALGARTDVIGGGTLTIQFDGAESQEITVPAGATLEELSEAINAADVGVGASLVTDADGTRVMIRSSRSGADQAFQISASADGSGQNGLSLNSLAYTTGQQGGSMTRTQEAANALFELNGLELESDSNRPEGVLENVALTLGSVTDDEVEIEIVGDGEAIRESMDLFISAYNELNGLIREQTRYDAETQIAGPLQGNRMVLMVQDQLRRVLRTTLPQAEGGGGEQQEIQYTQLSEIGLQIQRDGSLSLDESRFELAAQRPERLYAMFGERGEEASGDGFARQLDTLVGNILGVDGAITGAQETLRSQENRIQSDEDRLNRRLEGIEERLIRQYSKLDADLAQLNSALSSVGRL